VGRELIDQTIQLFEKNGWKMSFVRFCEVLADKAARVTLKMAVKRDFDDAGGAMNELRALCDPQSHQQGGTATVRRSPLRRLSATAPPKR
jgi:hypothetical protein